MSINVRPEFKEVAPVVVFLLLTMRYKYFKN